MNEFAIFWLIIAIIYFVFAVVSHSASKKWKEKLPILNEVIQFYPNNDNPDETFGLFQPIDDYLTNVSWINIAVFIIAILASVVSASIH